MDNVSMVGWVKVETVDPKTGVVKEVYKRNTVTNNGLRLFQAHSAAVLLRQALGIADSMLHVSSPLGRLLPSVPSNYTPKFEAENFDKGLNIILANTTANTGADTTQVPVFTNGELDNDKFVGYANYRRKEQITSSKEGYVYELKPDERVMHDTVVLRWEWGETPTDMTFNKIFLSVGVHADPSNSFYWYKSIDPSDMANYGGVDTSCPYYIMPGVTGLTEPNEILFSTEGEYSRTANAIFNLETGAITKLDSSDDRYGVRLGGGQQVFANGELYFSDPSNYNYLYRYNPETKVYTQVYNYEVTSMWLEGDILYYIADRSGSEIRAYNTKTHSNTTGITLENQSLSHLFTNINNSNRRMGGMDIFKRADGKYEIHADPNKKDSSYNYYIKPIKPLVVTDLNDIANTIVDVPLNRPVRLGNYLVNGQVYTIGQFNKTGNEHSTGHTVINQGYETKPAKYRGLAYTIGGFGQAITVVNLETPYVKPADKLMRVSYGITFTNASS